ncbi:MAG: ABC transporter permease [Nibricoccus sp.]
MSQTGQSIVPPPGLETRLVLQRPEPSRRDQRPASRVSMRLRWMGRLAVRVLSVLICVAAWEVASRNNWHVLGMRFENVPAPSEIWEAGRDLAQSPKVGSHIVSSLKRIFAGFAIAAVLATTLGLIIGRLRWAEDLLLSPLEVLRPIPAVAWIPLAILLWPTAESSMIFITFIGAFFPILLSTIHGVEQLDRRLVQASLTLGAGPLAIFREVIFPGALPSIVTGLSIGMGTAWFSLITAEMVSGQFGIGYFTWEAYTLQDYPAIVLGMLIIGSLGAISSAVIKLAGRRLTPWQALGGKAT